MEAMRARQKRAGTNMDDDLTNRYSARPGVPSSASQRKAINGVLVPSRTAFVGVKTKSTRPAKPDSDDEIDSLSSQAADSDDEERTRVTRVSTKQQAQEDDLLDVNGRKMPAHPNFPPRKAPLPKFKKNKTAPSGSSTSTDVTPSSSQSRVQFPASQSGTALDLAALKGNENGKLSRSSSTSGIAGTSPSQPLSSTFNSGSPLPNIRKKLPGTYPEPSPLAKSRSVSLEVLPPEPQSTKKGKEKAKPKPAPFPLDSSPADSSRSSRQAPSPRIRPSASTSKAPRTSGSARKVNKRRIISESEPDSDDDLFGSDPEETTPRGKATRPSNRQSSPAATPIASRSTADIDLTETRQQPKARPKPRAKIKQKTATDFPALSPLSSQAGADRSSSPELASTPKKRGGTAFPLSMYSPLSSPAPEPPSREKTAPFPMSISPLKLSPVSETPNAPIWEESDHDDRIDLTSSDVVVNLCPYCDALMPSIEERTPQLSRLLAAAERRSKPAPRPGHPHARRAPVSVHGAVCERHDFETKELPRARARGWPINIAWDALRGRIERLQPKLAKLVHGDEKARKESIFWRSVEEDVRKSGSRAVAGVKGQFESFDKVQPGYYGEKGAHIIYQTIYNLFPPSAFDVKLLGALSPDIVLQRVLVPEAALSLVMEDTDEDVATASRILVESARFGAIMYPLHDGDQDQRDIGQGMVRERARARAKVIAAEERVEEEMLREENEKRRKREELSEAGSEEGGRRARSTKRRKPTPDASVPTDGDDPPPRRVPKPRPRPVSRQMESDSDASVRSTRSTRSMRSRSTTASKPESGADSDIIEIVNPAVQARPKPRKVHKRTGAASASDMDISSGAERVHDVDATPRPLARQRQPRGQGKGASSSRNPDWSRSQREPLDISSSDDEEPGVTSRRSSGRAGDAGIPAADSWLLSE